jgi:hypothetical protein
MIDWTAWYALGLSPYTRVALRDDAVDDWRWELSAAELRRPWVVLVQREGVPFDRSWVVAGDTRAEVLSRVPRPRIGPNLEPIDGIEWLRVAGGDRIERLRAAAMVARDYRLSRRCNEALGGSESDRVECLAHYAEWMQRARDASAPCRRGAHRRRAAAGTRRVREEVTS